MGYQIKEGDITIKLEPGTDNTFYASWKWNKDKTKEYTWEWQYLLETTKNKWFEGSSGTSSPDNVKTASYTAPENASAIRFRVKPIAKEVEKKVNKKKKKVEAWKANYSKYKTYKKVNIWPETPSAPSAEIDLYTLKTSVDTRDELTTHIYFEVVRQIQLSSAVVQTSAKVAVSRGRAAFSCTVPAGGIYRVRCLGYNGDQKGLNWSPYSSDVYSGPAKISGTIKIEQMTDNSVKVSFLNTTFQYPTKIIIQYATNKDYFDHGGNVTSVTVDEMIGSTTYVTGLNIGSSGGEYYFRFASVNEKNIQGPWSDLIYAVLGVEPAAPTTWQSASTIKIGEKVILYWLHNSQDGSKERAAILRMTVNGVQKPDITIANNTWQDVTEGQKPSQYVLDTSNYDEDTEITWTVATRGVVNKYSPWSTTRKVNVYYPPTIRVSIFKDNMWFWDPFDFEEGNIYDSVGEYKNPYSLPDELISRFPVYIGVEVEPKSVKPLEANFKIFSTEAYRSENYKGEEVWVNDGEEIFSRTISYEEVEGLENTFHFALQPKDIDLEDGITYRLVCTVISSNGLSAVSEIIFTTDFEIPDYDINAEITYDDDLICCYIKPYCVYENTENLVSDISLAVYRKSFDGELIEIGRNLRNLEEMTVLDPHPTLKNVLYRIVATSKTTGRIDYYDMPPEPIDETAIVLQWNERWRDFEDFGENEEIEPAWNGQILKLPYNVDTSDSSNIDVSHVEYIGRSHPVSYYGTQIGEKLTLASAIPYDDTETMSKIRELSRYLGDVYVREPTGIGYWATVDISFSVTHRELSVPVNINATRVEGGV